MAISSSDFQLTLQGTYAGQAVVNVFYYRKATVGVVGDANRLNAAFQEDVLPHILNVSNTFVTYHTLTVINLDLLQDFDIDSPSGLTGEITTTQPGAKFLAYGFRYMRTTRQGRDGSKRFVGISEDLINDTGLSYSGPLVTAIPALAQQLGAGISALGADFSPMIPYRIWYANQVPEDPNPGRYILQDLFPVGTVSYRGLTTQNSRKR